MVDLKFVELGDIAEVTMGQSPKSEYYNTDKEGLPFLQGNKTFGFKYPSFDMYISSITKIAKKDSILMSVRAPVGDLNIASEDLCIGRGLCSLNMKNDNNNFLYYLLKFNLPNLLNRESGTVFGSINKKDIETLEVAIPKEESIQYKIVDILLSIDNLIIILKKINHNLEKMAEIIFNKYFENNDNTKKNLKLLHSENWKKIKLGEIISISSGKRPKQKVDMQNKEFKYPLYGASSIMGYVNEFLYNEEILIIGRVGTHGIVQRVKDASFPSDNTLIIKSKYYNFVYQILKRIDYDSLNTGSTQPLLTQKSIKNVEIVLPSLKLVNKYENYCRNLFNKIDINNKEIEKLTQLRDTLLPKLMSGEIDLSEIEV